MNYFLKNKSNLQNISKFIGLLIKNWIYSVINILDICKTEALLIKFEECNESLNHQKKS